MIAEPGTPATLFENTITNTDPRYLRIAGIRSAELVHAALTSSQLDRLSQACLSRDIDRSFGCPASHLSFDTSFVVDNFDLGRATENFSSSFATSLAALIDGGGLERTIPATAISSLTDFATWRAGKFRPIAIFPNETDGQSTYKIAWSGDGSLLATTTYKTIELRQLQTGKSKTFRTDNEYYPSVGLSPDGSRLVGVSERSVTVWDTKTNKVVFSQSFTPRSNATSRLSTGEMSAPWSPDGKWLITEAGLDTIVWNTATWKPHHTRPAASEAAWSADSQRYVLIGVDNRPISAEIYEKETAAAAGVDETSELNTTVFGISSGEVEAALSGPYRSGRWVTGGVKILLSTTSLDLGDSQSAAWSLDELGDPSVVELQVGSRVDRFSADGTLGVVEGRVIDLATGGALEPTMFLECCSNVADWSPDGHLFAIVNDAALFIFADEP